MRLVYYDLQAVKNKKTDSEYYVHWAVFLFLAMGAGGILLQVLRFGAIVEFGSVA
jgi:MFS superfamily sulfate permease-like transporter